MLSSGLPENLPEDLPEETFLLPLPEFIPAICDWLEDYDDDNFPNAALFHFVRALKGHPLMKGRSAEHAHQAICDLSKKLKAAICVADIDLREEGGQVAFFDLWERIRFPMGADPVETACELAGDGLIKTDKRRPGRFARFLTVAALLQLQVRQQPILLPVRKLAEHFPCEPNTVVAWIRWAKQDGVLIKTKDHAYRSAGTSAAAEYLLGLHLWPEALPRIGALFGVPCRAEDLAWLKQQFDEPRPRA